MAKNKKYYTPLGIILALIVILAIVLSIKTKESSQSGQQTQRERALGIKTLPTDQIPPGLPGNLPLEPKAQVLQNAELNSTSSSQSIRVYVSSQSIDQDFSSYQAYFSQNGWTLNTRETINLPNLKKLLATKDTQTMEVTIAKDSKGQVTVNVTVSK